MLVSSRRVSAFATAGLVAALVAVALQPTAPSARWALGAVLRGPSRWLPPAPPA